MCDQLLANILVIFYQKLAFHTSFCYIFLHNPSQRQPHELKIQYHRKQLLITFSLTATFLLFLFIFNSPPLTKHIYRNHAVIKIHVMFLYMYSVRKHLQACIMLTSEVRHQTTWQLISLILPPSALLHPLQAH